MCCQRDEKEDEALKLRNRHIKRRMLLLLHSTAKEMALMRRKDYISGRHGPRRLNPHRFACPTAAPAAIPQCPLIARSRTAPRQ